MPSSYTTLVADKSTAGSIKSWLKWDEAPSAAILENAQTYIHSRIRTREMLTLASGAVALNDISISISALRFLELQSLTFYGTNGQFQPQEYPLDDFERELVLQSDGSLYAGPPTRLLIADNTIRFEVKADAAYNYRLWYVKQPALLASSSNETNFLTDRYPHILTAACLYWGFVVYRDLQEREFWRQETERLIEAANDEAGLAQQGQVRDLHWGR